MAFQQSDLPKPVDELSQWIVPRVDAWERQRDQEHGHRWGEYYRLWRGVWAPEDKNRESERSQAIMPAIQQAIESAVAEQTEAAFGRERWFDAVDPESQAAADRLLDETWNFKSPISETFLLGALYGTGIAKIVVNEDKSVECVPVDPHELVIDPAAINIEDALGVAHVLYVPKNVVERRMESGVYQKVDLDLASLDANRMHLKVNELLPTDTDVVRLVEWHGLVPAYMLSDPPKDRIGPDGLVDAIVTIANDNEVLRENANPYSSRAFVSYQHDTVPRRFWGRGIAEKGYWPQKVLDSEIRARTDALAFSVHPMMAINAAMVPRGERFAVRPGRSIFLNGSPREAIQPIQFPPPDVGTFQQSSEMERMVEMATGQLQGATPIGINERNSTATGMSMILGASIRRTRKTLTNIERDFLDPLLQKVHERKIALVRGYPKAANLKIMGSLGIMAKEFELTQLTQLMNAMPEGLAQMGILKLIIQNSGLADKSEVLELLDFSIQRAANPPQEPPDMADMARLMSAETRAQEAQFSAREKEARLQLMAEKLSIEREKSALIHERQMIETSVMADKAEAELEKIKTESILNLAKAEAEELGSQINEYKSALELIMVQTPAAPAPAASQPSDEGSDPFQEPGAEPDIPQVPEAPRQAERDMAIERDQNGLIVSVDGRRVRRDDRGLISGLSAGL